MSEPRQRSRWWRGLCIALAALGLAEIGLRLLAPPPPFVPPAVLRGHSVRFTGDSTVTADYETRTPPFARRKSGGTKRIICCGSSSTYGLGLPPQSAWPWQLQRMLSIDAEVVDLARVGATSSDQVEIVKAALDLDPDLIILMEGNNEYQPVMAARAADIDYHPQAELTMLAAANSRLFGWMRHALQQSRPAVAADPPAAALKDVAVDGTDDRLVAATFRENLDEIQRLCAARHVPLMLCSVPVNGADDEVERDRHPLRTRPSFNQRIRTQSGVLHCDPAAMKPERFLDACHFNADGAATVARAVYEAIRDSNVLGVLPPAAPREPELVIWDTPASYGDLPACLRQLASLDVVPSTVLSAFKSANDRFSTVSFALADALPALDVERCTSPPLLALYGHTFLSAHRYRDAVRCYDSASRLRPHDARILVDLGWASYFSGDAGQAVTAWKRALALGAADRDVRRMVERP